MTTDLHDLAGALARGDAGAISAALGLPGAPTLADKLRALIREGLTYGEAAAVFGVLQADNEPALEAYVEGAKIGWHGRDDVSFDDHPIVSDGGDGGAWVSAWVWVSDEGASDE